jgi:hypothetical protein
MLTHQSCLFVNPVYGVEKITTATESRDPGDVGEGSRPFAALVSSKCLFALHNQMLCIAMCYATSLDRDVFFFLPSNRIP